jgi:hypothetical protein
MNFMHMQLLHIICHIILRSTKTLKYLSYSYDIHFKLCFHRCVLRDEVKKLDLTYIYFKEFLNKINLLYK